MNRTLTCLALVFLTALSAESAQPILLSEQNYESEVPQGKEVDAIYGDYLLKNDLLVAVVAAPGKYRDANMTVRNVGGSVIDLTVTQKQSDQLSCYYPGGSRYRYTEVVAWPESWQPAAPEATTLAFTGKSISLGSGQDEKQIAITTGYELRQDESFLRVTTTLTNEGEQPEEVTIEDGFRLDGDFEYGLVEEIDLAWGHEVYWGQAYGVQPSDQAYEVRVPEKTDRRAPQAVIYIKDNDNARIELAPGESTTWTRFLIPAKDSVAAVATARRTRGQQLRKGRLIVSDRFGAVPGARVDVYANPYTDNEQYVGVGVTNEEGQFVAEVPPGLYKAEVTAQGHQKKTIQGPVETIGGRTSIDLQLSTPSFVEGVIKDGNGDPIPAKVQLIALDDLPEANFGPDSAVYGVKNLQYTPSGRFKAKVLPGRYRWIASYGPEYDADQGEFRVEPGNTARIEASLPRTVDTTGWISSELHSHSSPSGDNTASQRGRVLNLLCEHLEFCPCTEHQRIDQYDPHLKHFKAEKRMLTCPGMELTGQPLPLNHQNAFPLIPQPFQQHGGAPMTDTNPIAQIKRLAEWDNNSEKVVQTDHPDIAQMIGDRDQDGIADAGFEEMFAYMDVIEVHPPELIFEPLNPAEPSESGVGTGGWEGRGNTIINWLQMLNLGYRVTGVVNTDAHYNFHGSGWLRNWVRSSTDDPAKASVAELIHEYEHGHVVMSNGPYLNVKVTANGEAAIPGDDLISLEKKVVVRVIVRCPNWIEVNRVQLFLNGKPVEEFNYTTRSHPDWFQDGPERFNQEIEVSLKEDTHIVVACCGEGHTIAGMYGGQPEWGRRIPVAVANPVFVDTDGDTDDNGIPFEHNGDGLGMPLPTLEGLKPSHGHDHPNHRH